MHLKFLLPSVAPRLGTCLLCGRGTWLSLFLTISGSTARCQTRQPPLWTKANLQKFRMESDVLKWQARGRTPCCGQCRFVNWFTAVHATRLWLYFKETTRNFGLWT
jgi:hypothetical protein